MLICSPIASQGLATLTPCYPLATPSLPPRYRLGPSVDRVWISVRSPSHLRQISVRCPLHLPYISVTRATGQAPGALYPSGLPPLGPQAARPPGVVIIGMLSGVMLRLFLFGIETGDTIEFLYPFADFFVKSFWAA